MNQHLAIPQFPFTPPPAYAWLIERGLIGFREFGPLQPWYYLDAANVFSVNECWPNGPSSSVLFAFARRQDNDDIACFELHDNTVTGIVLIHGWTSNGYSIDARYVGVWAWLKAVVDDIEQWNDG